jgi:drug/metabolite transporter (DMT)-like permease
VDEPPAPRRAALPALLAGLAALYLIWGSTYLGIKFAVETLPPFLMAGARFVLAGAVLYSVRIWQGVPPPSSADWRNGLLTGALLLLGGNGLVCWGQQFVPTGSAALLIATTPIWMALVGWAFYGGERPGPRLAAGLALGLVGAALLIKPSSGTGPASLWAMLSILAAPVLWSLGSHETRRTGRERDALMTSATQMLAGGALMLLAGALLGEWPTLLARPVSARSAAAFVYLTIFGSLIAFTTYSWLLRVASPTAVATYAYVNPLVAVLLGWAVLDEVPGPDLLMAAGLIVGAVVLITVRRKAVRPRPRATESHRAHERLLDRREAHAGCKGEQR